MSHVEAFGQLRSFVVGLEIKARDLRKVLETSRENGKWVNGKDGTGVGERCARAIGAARAEQVTQEMVAEVAEQDKLVRQVEEIVRTDKPVEEATEKYQALVEYNQLALEDLEERLSAYGYVRPDRVSLDRGTSDKVRPPVVSSPARLPARTAKTCRRTTTQDGGNHVSEGESSGGAVPAGRSSAAAAGGLEEARHVQVDSSFSQQQQRGKGYDGGDGLNAGNAGAAGRSDYAAGRDTGVSGDDDQGGQLSAEAATATATHRRGTGEMEEQEEAEVAHTDGGVSGRGAVTPARPALGVREGRQQEEEPFSPPTPESPGLADWEITEGAREMLRRAQPHQKQQQESSSSDSSSLAAPRSLEALLAENTVLSPAGAFPGGNGEQGGDGNGRRSSVSSDWSPPPSTTGGVGQPYHSSGGGSRRRRSFSDDDDGGGGGRGSATGAHTRSDERSDGETAAAVEAVAGGGGAGTETHSWGASSNPPTPARMYFEGRDTLLTPSGERSLAIAAGTGDRDSSLTTPSLGCRSPLKSDGTTKLMASALIYGERSDAFTPSDKAGKSTLSTASSARSRGPVNHDLPQENDATPPVGSVLTGPQDDFWGAGSSPESSVVAASRESTREVPAPMSPETPATPDMLSPRFRTESAVGSGGGGGGGGGIFGGADNLGNATGVTGADSSVSVALPVSRRLPLMLTAADSGDMYATTPNSGNGGASSDDDDYDSDKCPTPELSSPLRSSSISMRDLQVFTPSAKTNDGGGGCSGGGGGYGSTGSANDRDGDDVNDPYDSDECPTPELSSPLRSTDLSSGSNGSAALCRRRLEEAGSGVGEDDGGGETGSSASGGPLELVSEEEYARAPKCLTYQVSRSLLNETIGNLNAYAAPRLACPSELLLTVDEIMDIIDQGDLSRTLLLSAASLKRIEMKGARMCRIRA